MTDRTAKHYAFADWELDAGSRELRHADEVVPLEPKSFDLLLYLLLHRDRVVGKDELQDNVWPDVIVAESSLTRCVMKVRRAVNDDAEKPAVIGTVRRHGYRFLADVHSVKKSRTQQELVPEKPTVAVLPFASLSDDTDHAYLADGMTEDVITLLSGVPGLYVIARNSSFSYKDSTEDARQIGADLGARYVVEGSIRRVGQKIRVNVQLIDASDSANLWATRYDRPLAEIFDVQDEVTEGIAAALGNEVYRAEFARARKSDEDTLDAWGLVARAMAHYHAGFRRLPLLESIRLCREAIAKAPEFARANSSLAINLAMLVVNDWSENSERDTAEALSAGQRALELDADDVWVVYQWGAVNAYVGDCSRAVSILDRALDINPHFVPALAQMSRALIGAGRAEESLLYIEKAFVLSPRDLNSFALYLYEARACLQLRRYSEAAGAAQRSLNINSSWNFSWFIYAIICMALERSEEAAEALYTARKLQPSITRQQYERRLWFAAGNEPGHAKFLIGLLERCWPGT